jgi:hypothetical protein
VRLRVLSCRGWLCGHNLACVFLAK